MKKSKLSPLERNWVLYDVGNSAFTLLVSTLLPIYLIILPEMQEYRLLIILRTGDMQLR